MSRFERTLPGSTWLEREGRALRMRSRRDTPKAERVSEPVPAARALVDPVRTLGHPARGRKHR